MKPDSLQGRPGVSCESEPIFHGHFNFYCYLGCMIFYGFALILKPQFSFFLIKNKSILNITFQEQNIWLKICIATTSWILCDTSLSTIVTSFHSYLLM